MALPPTSLRRLAAANRERQNRDPSVLEGSPTRKRKPLPAIRIGQFPVTENPVSQEMGKVERLCPVLWAYLRCGAAFGSLPAGSPISFKYS